MGFIDGYLEKTRKKCYRLVEKYYPFPWKTPKEIYSDLIGTSLGNCHMLLDAGCGKGEKNITFRRSDGTCIGIDMDFDSLTRNQAVNHLVLGNLEHLPFRDGVFDLIVSSNVLEHLEKPAPVFYEFSRIAKPNARLIVRTPNVYSYASLVSKFSPFKFHKLANKLRGIDESDAFPTYYRANSVRILGKLGERNDLVVERAIMAQNWPSYLLFSTTLFRLGILHERIVNKFESLRHLRSTIVLVFRKSNNHK